jgi:hypothetical protein
VIGCGLTPRIESAFTQASRGGRLTTGGGGLAGVDMANDHDVDMELLLTVRVEVSSML